MMLLQLARNGCRALSVLEYDRDGWSGAVLLLTHALAHKRVASACNDAAVG